MNGTLVALLSILVECDISKKQSAAEDVRANTNAFAHTRIDTV